MLNKVKKFKIGDKDYNFKMTNKTVLKIDERYGNYGSVLEGIMKGKQFYTNALKLLSCSCVDKEIITIDDEKVEKTKEFTIDQLVDELTPEQLQSTSKFVVDLYFDYMGVEEKIEGITEKN